MNYVIIGNSIAGMEAAITLRQREPKARITVVSGEHPYPFSRVALMYMLCGQLRLEDTYFHPTDAYDKLNLIRVHDWVEAVDPVARTLRLRKSTLSFDKLLLAVGSRARRLPFPGAYDAPCFHFVTLDDYAALNEAAKPGMSVAVIGGGLIGVEVAEVLHLRGLKTHFLIREPWYFPVALDSDEAEHVADHIRHHGVDCRTGVSVTGRNGKRLEGAEIDVDLVVGSIGVEPATGFLKDSGIALSAGGAVETGDDLQSLNTPGVYAAGDCANVTWLDGARRPEQLWYTGRDQGRAAARAMLGDEVRYRRGTWYNSAKFFDLEYTTAGFIPVDGVPVGWSRWFQKDGQRTLRIMSKDGAVKGLNGVGSRWNHAVWLRWIYERRSVEYVLAHLLDSNFDSEFSAPFQVNPHRSV